MKLNKKGFTLVELLAMLTILGILMAVAVPNMSGILGNHKNNILADDATKMVNKAKTKIATEKVIQNPSANKCLIFNLEYLDDSDDFKAGPNGGHYNVDESYVIVKRETTPGKPDKYKYYVRLVEVYDGGKAGIADADYDEFVKDNKAYIDTISNTINIANKTQSELVAISEIGSHCSSGFDGVYYKEKIDFE